MNRQAATEATKVIERFGTRDPLFIARKSGVRIVYGNWHPVTVGEFDRRARTIRVNLRAVEAGDFTAPEIVAHELGHFFALGFGFDRKTEESFASRFAEELIGKV